MYFVARDAVDATCHPEVRELDLPAQVDQHVRRLQVAVHHAAGMHVVEPTENASSDNLVLPVGERDAVLLNKCVQVALEVLEADVHDVVRRNSASHEPNDVWVVKACKRVHLSRGDL